MTISANQPLWLHAETLGAGWLAMARAILSDGVPGRWDGRPLREIFRATVEVPEPATADPIIARLADPERLAWMHRNFTDHARVQALGNADSYATRLYDYAHSGRDQIAHVVSRLRADRFARDAAITTFQPLTDTSYVPCISLLDFWLQEGRLQLAVYAHGIDFGTKGYANLIELAALQHRVAGELQATVGTLNLTVKSAHIYDVDVESMTDTVAARDDN